MKRKISENNQVSRTKKSKVEEVKPISTGKRKTRSMKPKISGNKQVSRTKKPKVKDIFPIKTILQNPGLRLISRNIFKYLKLEDFSNCRLVSKSWKQFIDEDKYLADVQLTEVMFLYSKEKISCNQQDYCQRFPLTQFHFVCAFASFQIVKLFLENKLKWKIDVNAQDENGVTPLYMACRYNNVLVVNHLLDHGLNITRRTKNIKGHILHAATFNKDPKVTQAVFENKRLMNTGKNVTTSYKYTVFHSAACNEFSAKPLAYLLENATKFNLKINQLTRDHENVFHPACRFGHQETVKFLIQNAKKYAIDLNMRDRDGNTPFQIAIQHGQFHKVKILLENSKKYNINIYSKNNNGMDGQDLAEYEGRTKIVKLIKSWKHQNKP